MKIPLLVWACLIPLKYKGRSLQPYWWFSSFCDLKIPKTSPAEAWILSRKCISNVLQSTARRLKATVLDNGEKQELSPYQSALWGWAHSNIEVRFIAVPKLGLLSVRQYQCLWPIWQKPAYTCFHSRQESDTELRASVSIFGTSLGSVINFQPNHINSVSPAEPRIWYLS